MLVTQQTQDINTPTGPMRTYVYRPDAPGQFP
ncbi:MAG: dienelactone hydrolase family protein, partial [Shewanella sp.]